MRRKWIYVSVAVGAIALMAVAAWLAFGADPKLQQQALAELGLSDPTAGPLIAAGFIEAEETTVTTELGGRIAALEVVKGQMVEATQTLLQLDTTLIDAEIALARAAVTTAEAQLAQAQAPPRPAQLRQAETMVDLAQRLETGAHQAWQDTLALRETPQELNAEIARARSEVVAARAAVRSATAIKDAAEIGYDAFHEAQEEIRKAQERWEDLPEAQRPPKPELETQLEFHLLPNAYWQAWVALNAAHTRWEIAQTALADLLRMREDPQELNAQVDAAATRHALAEAGVEQAQARLNRLQAGTRAEQLALLEAQVRKSEAEVETLLSQREKLTLVAPTSGMVLRLSLRQGELALPRATILTLSNLDEVTLTVFVPEPRLAEVRIGQNVAVTSDSYPDRVFRGEVVAIAAQAEFAPREIEIREERMNLVFAVDVLIPNPDHALKPGTYAEADFGAAPPGFADAVASVVAKGGER